MRVATLIQKGNGDQFASFAKVGGSLAPKKGTGADGGAPAPAWALRGGKFVTGSESSPKPR